MELLWYSLGPPNVRPLDNSFGGLFVGGRGRDVGIGQYGPRPHRPVGLGYGGVYDFLEAASHCVLRPKALVGRAAPDAVMEGTNGTA